MGYLGRRIGLSQDSGDSNPGGADGAVGGGILDLFAQGYFQREGNIYNNPGILSGLTATGGVVSEYTEGSIVYRSHVFTESGTFSVTELGTYPAEVEYLVVAGGGGGSFGGGGAGGVKCSTEDIPSPRRDTTLPVSTSPGSYTVTIGAGGEARNTGSNSVFGPITASGGGFGGGGPSASPQNTGPGGAGGSGGGGGHAPSDSGAGDPGGAAPDSDQGFAGGIGYRNSGYFGGGGGGGAGGAGSDAPGTAPGDASDTGGNGGIGLQSNIAGPSNENVGAPGPSPGRWYAGGGGGAYTGPDEGLGGGPGGPYAGGGDGSSNSSNTVASTRGTTNTGGGGGGGNGAGAAGGSGIVIVRYQIASANQARATGGSVSFYNNKTIHTFTGSGTFATEPNWTSADVEYVVIGGGGYGGPNAGTGGGAGAYKKGTTPIGSHPVSTTITVGGGGSASSFGSPITAPAGGNGTTNSSGNPGGSGAGGNPGGTGTGDTFPGNLADSVPSNGWGHDGGNQSGSGASRCGGGGGGAGGSGDNGAAPNVGGDGGEGIQLPATFRNPLGFKGGSGPTSAPTPNGFDTSGEFWVAGGGGGSSHYPGPNPGGSGGGAPPSISPYSTPWSGGGAGGKGNYPSFSDPERSGKSGAVNTGGGGGASAGGGSAPTGSGGSGLVLIAYPT